ncbi:high affinity nicotinic acid plasma membrane permease [Ascobolus immersus RN42]|uniref:High affinity nicotinic acid plasma membrane permease n=1 Tax=Ascobolus immersus RN42 TaxID=1160509 RepID=A0A3N4I9Z3_ASCIM|nr:high affinity nicotinic acid plasma membrane permease [Ascobolus immersus RN42]
MADPTMAKPRAEAEAISTAQTTEEPVSKNDQTTAESFRDDEHDADESLNDKRIEKIYHKLDRRILPGFWILYFVCAAIRSNVGISLTMNSETGDSLSQRLGLSQHQISVGVAVFYVCYVLFDVPANLIMTRVSPHIWMSRIVLGVSVVGACHAAISAAWNFYLLRILLGIVIAGMWPGMAYYLTLFYPPNRTGRRIGSYYTAAQLSAAVVGLVSAGFQKMNRLGGLRGYEWMFLIYGLVGIVIGFLLLWWLPDRPRAPGQEPNTSKLTKFVEKILPKRKPAFTGEDGELHYQDLKRAYKPPQWGIKELIQIISDWRIWPLIVMYFGVVGVGIGLQIFGTLIIRSTNPNLTSIELSLLFAPIWIADLIAILIVTPISDLFHHHRPHFFIFGTLTQITGLLLTTYHPDPWTKYAGLLIVGFGLGPTVPIIMTWSNEIFQRRHGEVGVAAATAIVSGLGNCGSIFTTYALYTGWESDRVPGQMYRKSNLTMVGILGLSTVAAVGMGVAMRLVDGKEVVGGEDEDGAARGGRGGRGWFKGGRGGGGGCLRGGR